MKITLGKVVAGIIILAMVALLREYWPTIEAMFRQPVVPEIKW